MPAIPIYSASPINAASKADGATPQTAAAQNMPTRQDQESSTTAPPPSRTTGYAAAEPEARPSLPVQTGIPQPSAAFQPTPTSQIQSGSPPAPQPGAVPSSAGSSHLPPPPKAGETLNSSQAHATSQSMPMPPQMAIPPPSGSSYVPRGSSTITAPHASVMAGPGQAQAFGGNLSHPPGYHQDVHASEFNSTQRAAHEAMVAEQESKPLSLSGDGDTGVWDTAKKWAAAAGDSLAAAENEVWKRINKD